MLTFVGSAQDLHRKESIANGSVKLLDERAIHMPVNIYRKILIFKINSSTSKMYACI
jgi:hypothetical protein